MCHTVQVHYICCQHDCGTTSVKPREMRHVKCRFINYAGYYYDLQQRISAERGETKEELITEYNDARILHNNESQRHVDVRTGGILAYETVTKKRGLCAFHSAVASAAPGRADLGTVAHHAQTRTSGHPIQDLRTDTIPLPRPGRRSPFRSVGDDRPRSTTPGRDNRAAAPTSAVHDPRESLNTPAMRSDPRSGTPLAARPQSQIPSTSSQRNASPGPSAPLRRASFISDGGKSGAVSNKGPTGAPGMASPKTRKPLHVEEGGSVSPMKLVPATASTSAHSPTSRPASRNAPTPLRILRGTSPRGVIQRASSGGLFQQYQLKHTFGSSK